jgi:hypothetical protein
MAKPVMSAFWRKADVSALPSLWPLMTQSGRQLQTRFASVLRCTMTGCHLRIVQIYLVVLTQAFVLSAWSRSVPRILLRKGQPSSKLQPVRHSTCSGLTHRSACVARDLAHSFVVRPIYQRGRHDF